MTKESSTPDRREEILKNTAVACGCFLDPSAISCALLAMTEYASLVCSKKDERIKRLEIDLCKALRMLRPVEAARDHWKALAEELETVLQEAELQINYLHEKFKETGSGNSVLLRIESALSRFKEGGKHE